MMTRFSLLILTLILLSTNASFSLSIKFPNPNSPAGAENSLFGDAHLAGDGHSVQLNQPTPSSFGIILRSTPFKFSLATSFVSNFTFEIGNGVALVIIPSDFPSKLSKNSSYGLLDVNRFVVIEFDVNVCKIVSSRVRVSNVSKILNVLKSGVKLTAWIDYHASLKRLDVRLSKLGDSEPVEPLISYRIDLGEMWKSQEALLGLASSNGNLERITIVYSWRSEIKDVPKWLHSNPINPQDHSNHEEQSTKKRGCFLSGIIFSLGCGGLTALALFFVWSYVVDRQKTRGQLAACPVDLRYEKIGVLEVKNQEAAMK